MPQNPILIIKAPTFTPSTRSAPTIDLLVVRVELRFELFAMARSAKRAEGLSPKPQNPKLLISEGVWGVGGSVFWIQGLKSFRALGVQGLRSLALGA